MDSWNFIKGASLEGLYGMIMLWPECHNMPGGKHLMVREKGGE